MFNLGRHQEVRGSIKFRVVEIIIIMGLCIGFGVVCSLGVTIPLLNHDKPCLPAEENFEYQEIANVLNLVVDNFYETVDKNELTEAAIKGMLSYLGDRNTYYFTEAEKNDFDERMHGEYKGIGVELTSDGLGNIIIVNVFPDSPAAIGGLQVGDSIKEVDKQDTKEMTGADIASYIKDEKITAVTLKIARGEEIITVKVNKEKVVIDSVVTEIIEEQGKRLGYIDISVFAGNTYQQFREKLFLLEDEGIDALIIDVRTNAGGYLDAVVDMLEMFLKTGEVVYQMETSDEVIVHYAETKEMRDYPVAVLINENSASAAEILAAAFKEVYGSEIIGMKSFGKGTVQETRELENGGMVKITTQKWLTPEGNSIDKEGVEPTIVVEQDENYYFEPTLDNDKQLQKAIKTLIK